MKFNNPEFQPGLNATIRAGADWFGKLRIGQKFYLGSKEKIGICRFLFVSRYCDLSEFILSLEHCPELRDKDKLYQALKAMYPKMGPEDVVSAVGFEVL
jgi:hypothetical protein